MDARFRLTPGAESQLGEIVEFIAADSEAAALRVRDALYEAFTLLAERPGIGHFRKDLTSRSLKFWTVYSYLVAYDPASSPLVVVAVLHGARDVPRLLNDAE
jgi:plasmid stabilization system protein ParE